MKELIFRDARYDDLPQIVEIYNSTIPSRMVTADTIPVTVESRVRWFEEHSPDKRPIWIVESSGNETIGWVSFQSFYGRPAYDATVEISIYLDQQQRNKGYGKSILQYAISEAPRFGIKTLLGLIFAHNEPSLRLFRHFGFEDWGVFPGIAVLDRNERTLIILGKRITD